MTKATTIRVRPGERIVIIGEMANKPGPKSIPKSSVRSSDIQAMVLDALSRGVATAREIQDAVKSRAPGVTTNAVAWALVELQNSTRKRSKNPDNQGPVEKIGNQAYRLRA